MATLLQRLIHDKRGGSELIAIAVVAALVIAFAFGPGKDLMTRIGSKYTQTGDCIENPNLC